MAKRTRLVDVRRRLAIVHAELVEWRDLKKALDKGGLPDLEIDAAGPTITATTNALLTSCYSTRFTVELVTQVEKADKSGMRDEFTVKVMDNEAGGDWRDIAQLSGGEKTVVQEALMCAIALYVNERAPMPIRTLWRDETGAALDPQNAIAYVHMLRKVLELGNFHHVFFISHNAAAAALADTQIQVGGGTATIVSPPFMEAA
jgi:DNA repair exonuclease SbcCD ATPase subunit